MEARLSPINAVLGLCGHGGDYSPESTPLRVAGFRVVALELPIRSFPSGGKVVIDVLLLHEASSHLVACEAKSGRNIEVEQAKRYNSLDARTVVQAGSVTLPSRVAPSIEALYICLAEHEGDVRRGLEVNGIAAGLLAVASHRITVHRTEHLSSALRLAFPEDVVSLPFGVPRLVRFDPDSAQSVIDNPVQTALVSLLAQRQSQISVRALAEKVLPELPMYGRAAQSRFVKKVEAAVREAAAHRPDYYAVDPTSGTRDGVVRILRTPENLDPRGRTQAYQALGRPNGRRRRRDREDPAQLDMLAELAKGDTESGIGEDDDSEGQVER